MYRKIRISLAVVFWVGLTLLFLDFTGAIHLCLGWMAKIHILPALLALKFGVIAILIILTLLFGRIYCSVICPLGVFQDGISWLSGRRKGKKFRFTHSKPLSALRWGIFIAVLVSFFFTNLFVGLFDPYSIYGRFAANALAPLYALGNNLLALGAEKVGSYAVYGVDVWVRSMPTLIIAIACIAAVTVLSWRGGRTYCNTICPVGTILGAVSRFSVLKIRIDADKCNKCGLCARKCKASCINSKEHSIDYSRCVACMDCLETCKHGAITFGRATRKATTTATTSGPSAEASDLSRRTFLSLTALAASAAALNAQDKTVDGGLAELLKREIPNRNTPITPPGSLSAKNLSRHCTACGLCIAECPNGVLRPSTKLETFMQPELSYERGYCRPECTRCSEVCPTGAITKITKAEKTALHIGQAKWLRENCLPVAEGVSCGNCAKKCPSGAILMVKIDPSDENSLLRPSVGEWCIGCGACENLCPARPFPAIYVEGHSRHFEY